MTLARLAERIRSGDVSPREAVEQSLSRIAAAGELNAFISVRGDEALVEAERAPDGPLRGVPVAIKDVIDVAGARTTAASSILRDNVASRDAESVARLRAAGAVVVGKLNTHEFAFGALTTSPHFGPAHNPWSLERVCGGSSGGNGAAVAADLVPGGLGTDTAGSIRIPSCFCGVTGLRPSTGLVPTGGVVTVSRTFDTVGPIARSAEDCSLLLEALAPSYRPELDGGVRGLRIGVVDELFERADPEVAACAHSAVEELRALGAGGRARDDPAARPGRDDPPDDHAPRGGRGASPLAAHEAPRVRRRRPCTPARGPAAAVDRVRDRAAGAGAVTATSCNRCSSATTCSSSRRCPSCRRGSATRP